MSERLFDFLMGVLLGGGEMALLCTLIYLLRRHQ